MDSVEKKYSNKKLLKIIRNENINQDQNLPNGEKAGKFAFNYLKELLEKTQGLAIQIRDLS